MNGLAMIDKKEIRRQYKGTIQPMGVYRITNLANGRIFVESSKNLNAISNRNLFQLRGGLHVNEGLQKDFKQYGESSFAFEVVDRLDPKEGLDYDYSRDLKALEDIWLEKLQPYGDRGYNNRKR
jgi:hypothetical protein